VLDDAFLADWCLRYLGAPFERVLFRSGFLSEVVGVELSSGLRAVVKARPFQPRIGGCLQVQAALARVGFPCPEPLTVATRVHGMTVTAETEVPGGSPLPTEAGAAPFAALLARLIGSAPAQRLSSIWCPRRRGRDGTILGEDCGPTLMSTGRTSISSAGLSGLMTLLVA
jgi:hypothetical protein